METEAIDDAINELELRLERLRSLYEQYFLGIEKIEPAVARKDVDRRIWLLRREKIRNTARRFKLQTIIQRYNTFQQYWQRICREIENGTYRRHLLRAERNFGPSELLTITARKRFGRRRDVVNDESRPPAASVEENPIETGSEPAAEKERALPASGLLRPPPAKPAEPRRPNASDLGRLSLDSLAASAEEDAANPRPLKPPKPRAKPASLAQVRSDEAAASRESLRPMPIKSIPPDPPRPKAQAVPARARVAPAPAARPGAVQAVPAVPAGSAARPPLPPAPRPPVPPARTLPGAVPPAPARPAPPPRPPPAPARPVPAPTSPRATADTEARPKAAKTGSAVTPANLDDLHSRLVAARRETRESEAVNKRALARQLRVAEETLRARHGAHRSIEFDIVVRDGRAIVKPIVR